VLWPADRPAHEDHDPATFTINKVRWNERKHLKLLFTSLAIHSITANCGGLRMGSGAMLGIGHLGSRWVFVLALMIGVAGCGGNPTRFNDDRRPGQQASVAPTARPPGVTDNAKGKASYTSPPRTTVTGLPSGKSASLGNSAVHVVKRGDTVNKISRLHPKPVAEIAKANAKAEDALKAPESTALPLFHWPVQGRIIASFGSLLDGGRNDGINLAVPEGSPVKAAEDGIVSYAGNGFKGHGNLVLIRHSNGYFTVYAHAKELLV
jgi:murein DD-endopeptidase MepM/ murein hydrolase activator NlpD